MYPSETKADCNTPANFEESQALINDPEYGNEHIVLRTAKRRRDWLYLSTSVHIIIEFALCVLLRTQSNFGQHTSCVQKHNAWSPVNKLIQDDYETRRFYGNFETFSPYKGPPTPEVAKAWSSLWETGAISITEDEFQQLNASPAAVKVPDDLGGGRMALLEVTHQLHCLNMLWKNTYPDYFSEEYNFSKAEPAQFHEHIDHCADMLRQKLMCDADGTIITYNWLKGHYMPHPNFNVEHKCRSFDEVINFAYERQVDASSLGQNYWTRPAEYVEFEKLPYLPDEDGEHFPRSK